MRVTTDSRRGRGFKAVAAMLGLAAAAGTVRRAAKRRDENVPEGRKLDDFGRLYPAEKRLLRRCAEGKVCELGKSRPDERTPANAVRASLIRFLILGGDKKRPVHELGVWLKGAWIEGNLDLECVRSKVFVALLNCHIDGLVRAVDAELLGMNLEGSRFNGLDAGRLKLKGSLFLRNGTIAQAEVRLEGAEIGGNLDCDGGEFHDKAIPADDAIGRGRPLERADAAVRAEALVIGGDVLMGAGDWRRTDRKVFTATGEVRLNGAKIQGNLACSKGVFNANVGGVKRSTESETPAALRANGVDVKGDVFFDKRFKSDGMVSLIGSQINGSLHCSDALFNSTHEQHGSRTAFDAQRMIVRGKFELVSATISGEVNLTAAHVGSLVDGDARCWPRNALHLDGFCYERISDSQTDSKTRIAWLRKQVRRHLTRDFKPQPWEQIIRVLRATGHLDEAAKVAIKKEKIWGLRGRMSILRRVFHGLHWIFASFGYRPLTTILWLAIISFALGRYYEAAAEDGFFGPTAPVIQLSGNFTHCGPGRTSWTSASCRLPPEYTSFDPYAYSLDLILPFVDVQQETSWAPITSTEGGEPMQRGWRVRTVMWFEILFGWVMSLLLVASLGRLLNRE